MWEMKASRPSTVMENLVLGLRPMNCLLLFMYPSSSKFREWLAKLPSVRSSKFLMVVKSTESFTIKIDIIPNRTLLSKALLICSRLGFIIFFGHISGKRRLRRWYEIVRIQQPRKAIRIRGQSCLSTLISILRTPDNGYLNRYISNRWLKLYHKISTW